MEDTLLSQRKYFNERLEKTSKIKNLKIRYQTKLDLLQDESKSEFAYRSGLIRGKIIGLGLESQMLEIVECMNAIAHRVNPSDIKLYTSAKHVQQIVRARSDSLLQFGLDYVDRWIMYNNLFSNGK